jgi:hypothetical protein
MSALGLVWLVGDEMLQKPSVSSKAVCDDEYIVSNTQLTFSIKGIFKRQLCEKYPY